MTIPDKLGHDRQPRSEVTPLVENPKKLRKPKGPSNGRKASVLISAVAMQTLTCGVMYSLPVFYPELIATFNSNRSDAVLVQSLFAGICHGGGIIWPPLIRRFGLGPCSIIGGIIGAVAFGVNMVATDLNMVIITVGLIAGFGMCCCYLTPYISVSWTFHRDPGKALVSVTLGSSLGQFICPYLTEIFIQQYQLRGAFLLWGALTTHVVVFALVIHQSREYFDSGASTSQPSKEGNDVNCLFDLTLFKDAGIAVLLINCFLIDLTGNMESWFMVDILVSRGFERKRGSLIVSLMGLAMLIGRVIAITMQFKCRIPSIYHLVYTFCFVGIGHIAVISIYNYWYIVVSTFLTTLLYGFGASQIPAVMYEASGLERYPQGMSLVNLAYGLGNLVLGPLGGFIRDTYGDYSPMFYLGLAAGIFISLTTGIAAFKMKRRRQDDQEILVKYSKT